MYPAFGKMPPVNFPSDSDGCIDLIKCWLKECRQTHECADNSAVSLPTRVVDVGGENTMPRLVETSAQHKAEYLTLSYVWGNKSKGLTVKENLKQRLSCIDPESLCKTHQDAISITRKLGFQYIWIDALCIIQDDSEDWEKEAAQMYTIYQTSVLTLAATSSPDGDSGILKERPPNVLAKAAISVVFNPSESTENEDGDVEYKQEMLVSEPDLSQNSNNTRFVDEFIAELELLNGPFVLVRKPVLSHGFCSGQPHKYWTVHDFPLDDRAWCFQEHILATRVVHFGKEELVWECDGNVACECGGMVRKGTKTLRNRFRDLFQTEDPQAQSDNWMQLVHKCIDCKITKESDRLPTLSGLAKAFQQQGCGEYLAGLWREHLLPELLWRCDREQSRRTSSYRAPTWSFASVEKTRIYNALDHIFPTSRQFLATVYSAVCRPAGPDPLGNVAEGWLTLTAPARSDIQFPKSTLESTIDTQSEQQSDSQKGSDKESGFSGSKVKKDVTVTPESGESFLHVAICRERQLRYKAHGKGVESLFCLVLRRAQPRQSADRSDVDNSLVSTFPGESDGTYERVGLAEFDSDGEPEEWLRAAASMTVTII